MGPVDWTHPTAKDMPPIWREAEQNPEAFMFNTGGIWPSQLLALRMYDGWPYWEPRPAILFEGPLGPEWNHFTSYGVGPNSITRKVVR